MSGHKWIEALLDPDDDGDFFDDCAKQDIEVDNAEILSPEVMMSLLEEKEKQGLAFVNRRVVHPVVAQDTMPYKQGGKRNIVVMEEWFVNEYGDDVYRRTYADGSHSDKLNGILV